VRTPAPSSRRTCPSWFRCFNEYYYYYVPYYYLIIV
jgi:hypothetical protein